MEQLPSEDTSGIALVESGVLRADQAKDYSSHASRREDTRATKIICSSNSFLDQSKACSQKESISSSDPKRDHQFSSNHSKQEGLQNEDQLEIKQWCDRQVTAKQDIWAEGNFVEMHERKLQKELKKLSAQSWPSRDRLAVFSDVFDDVCEGLPVFGRILREIKTDYDLYINHLMGSHFSQHMLLNVSVKDTDKVREMKLVDAEKEICELEKEARKALEENKRVQHELQNIPAIMGLEDGDMKNASLSKLQDNGAAINHTSIVQIRRLQVLNVWKEIQDLEEEINEKLMSSVTTAATERHIKDLKTEVINLVASNDRLRTINKDLKKNINVVLDREKASKAARRMLWAEINKSPNRG